MITMKITGLENLRKRFADAPQVLEREVGLSLGKSIAMVETESKRRTPVRTGYLRSSIGGASGFSFVRGLTAGVGTNVNYAIHVHEGYGRHKIGERKFMEKGLGASKEFIKEKIQEAMNKLAAYLTQ